MPCQRFQKEIGFIMCGKELFNASYQNSIAIGSF